MLFGIGHFYFPNSRYSAGIKVLDRLAQYHQLEWQVNEDLASFVAEGRNFLLVKPRTNGPLNNYKSLRACLRHYTEISPDQDLIICHHDVDRNIGSYEVSGTYWGDSAKGRKYVHESLKYIEDHTRLVDFRRVAIGISPPPNERLLPSISNLFNGMHEHRMSKIYIHNKFPADQLDVLDNTIFSDMAELTKTIFSSRTKSSDDYNSDDAGDGSSDTSSSNSGLSSSPPTSARPRADLTELFKRDKINEDHIIDGLIDNAKETSAKSQPRPKFGTEPPVAKFGAEPPVAVPDEVKQKLPFDLMYSNRGMKDFPQ